MTGIKKVSAILEVFGIYVAGQFVGFLAASLLGLKLQNPLLTLSSSPIPAELLQVTVQFLILIFFQYFGWFLLAYPIGWWHRRRSLHQYGFSLSGQSLSALVLTGVALFAFVNLPTRILEQINLLYPLGEQAAWRQTLLTMNWSSWEFWLLMAIGSFGLIPILEETFYRGYVQTRLEEDLGPMAAILCTACLFAFSHGQYLMFNVYNVSILAITVLEAIAWGYVFYRTRSLLPTILAHMLVNFPVRGAAAWGLLLAMVAISVIARREIGAYIHSFLSMLKDTPSKWLAIGAALLGAGYAVGNALADDIFFLLGLLFFVLALVFEWMERRKSKGKLQEVAEITASQI